MSISQGSKIKLEDGKEYLVVSGIKLVEGVFCLLSSLSEPIDMKVVELVNNDNGSFVCPYEGWGYKHIFDKLIDKMKINSIKKI